MGEQIPKLGFGLMRLPQLADETIDIAQVKQMVDAFMAAGFTYFDTAYVYGNGASELAIKEALVDRYPRESYQLTTKLPVWANTTPEDVRNIFETSHAAARRRGISIFTCCTMLTATMWLISNGCMYGNMCRN